MIRCFLYSAIGIVIGGIIGILLDAAFENTSPDSTLPILGALTGAVIGCFVGIALNRHYRLHPAPFAPRSAQRAPVYLSIAIDASMLFFLMLFVGILIFLNPSEEGLDTFMASPLPFFLDTVVYTVSAWVGVWFLKRRGYLSASYSRHALSANTTLFILIGNAVLNWQGFFASPLLFVSVFVGTGGILYGLTRLVLKQVL